MQDLMDFLATKEVGIVLGILGGILAIYLLVLFREFLKKQDGKKLLKNNTLELNKLVEQVKEVKNEKTVSQAEEILPEVFTKPLPQEILPAQTIVAPTVSATKLPSEELPDKTPLVNLSQELVSSIEVQPVVVKEQSPALSNSIKEPIPVAKSAPKPIEILDVDDEKQDQQIEYKEEVYTKTEAQQELERLTEELRKAEQEAIEETITLTEFEAEQEENAIISLEELLQKGKTLTSQNEITQYQDEGNEPISLTELEKRYQQEQVTMDEIPSPSLEPAPQKVVLDDFYTATKLQAYQAKSRYQPSPVISPIFGIEEEHLAKPTALELENTANYEKLDEEIRKTNEFLAKLRELQKKLD